MTDKSQAELRPVKSDRGFHAKRSMGDRKAGGNDRRQHAAPFHPGRRDSRDAGRGRETHRKPAADAREDGALPAKPPKRRFQSKQDRADPEGGKQRKRESGPERRSGPKVDKIEGRTAGKMEEHTADRMEKHTEDRAKADTHRKADGENGAARKNKHGSRSAPSYEYNLVDATPEERKLILEGGIVDRINSLSLLCARNPSAENYKQLLFFAKGQRNDVIYLVLKNTRDLLKEHKVEDVYVKFKIIKSFEMGVKNQYIKDKVLEMVGVLIRASVYAEELTTVLVERLGEKGSALGIVEKELRSVYGRMGKLIDEGIEDFYYKNDNFHAQNNVLKMLNKLEFHESPGIFRFLDDALATVDRSYSAEQRDILSGLIIAGLSKAAYEGCTIQALETVKSRADSAKTAMATYRLLVKVRDSNSDSYALKIAKLNILRHTKHESEFLNLVAEHGSQALVVKLANTCFYHSEAYIAAVLMLVGKAVTDQRGLYSLFILGRHSHPVVRHLALRLLRKEKIAIYDPFDSVVMSSMAERLARE